MADHLQIELLADHPEAIPVLKSWFECEWAPFGLVALSGDEVCGTAALKKESVTTHTHLTPWLAALLVGTGFRRRGVGEQFIAPPESAHNSKQSPGRTGGGNATHEHGSSSCRDLARSRLSLDGCSVWVPRPLPGAEATMSSRG